ncbi:MAG: hypothetical protein IID09_09120 [Candidatus Hydrogenedentes bacterium]|nr:hypothetical protein [Candidatus Hydrogenedentota bacterium]
MITITIIDLGGEVYLPYLLAAESVVGILIGLVLWTPQVQIASVLLLASAHVSYYVFLFVGKTGFETQQNYVPYTVAVAGFTFVGGFVWERYLRRIQGGGRWEHDGLVSIPYLAATLLLTTLMTGILPAPYVPLGQNALGVVLLCLGALSGLAGLRISGILALAVGTATFYSGLFTFGSPLSEDPNFFPILLLVLSSYIAAERLLALTIESDPAVSRINRILCILLVAVVGLLGGLGLWEWAPQERLTFFWLGLAVAMMVLGALFRESRYRWASLAVYFVVIVRAYAYDLTNLSPLVQFISFTALCLPLLVMSWAYSQYRIRHLGKLKSRHGGGATSDG